jgi:NADH-quinone oxidoreductase subunit J
MESNLLMFFLFSAMILSFSILAVTSRRILRAAVYLLFVLISTAGLYFLLNYQFLAAVQITLYAGGIVVLIIFSILLTSQISEKLERPDLKKVIFSAVLVSVGAIMAIATLLGHSFSSEPQTPVDPSMQHIGRSLLNYGQDGYALPFEVISVLLLAAMIASIIIAKKEKTEQP